MAQCMAVESGATLHLSALTDFAVSVSMSCMNVEPGVHVDNGLSISESGAHSAGPLTKSAWAAIGLGAAILAGLVYRSISHSHEHSVEAKAPSLAAVAPFASLLLCIALLPLIPATAHWWENNLNRLKVSLGFGVMTLAYYALAFDLTRAVSALEHAVVAEYVPFMVLLFSLYVISGGISLRGDLAAHPATNTAFLAIGTAIASLIGTTGASMVLIRPLLQTNSERKHIAHTVIFFIFLVSNIGGSLLPIGDPPLFLGFLRGVPFFWTLCLWKEWLFLSVVLLSLYWIWDTVAYRHEQKRDLLRDESIRIPLTIRGAENLIWLAGVMLAVAVIKPGKALPFVGWPAFPNLRELAMLFFVVCSRFCTDREILRSNQFNYKAILEVAALFIGIFLTMQAPVEILRASGDALSPFLATPARFFWTTGVLSSFLDNAPTYVVFFETAASMTPNDAPGVLRLADGTTIFPSMLIAISLGAVFMGANTYIGNGPNFMVKSIAEQSGVKMPGFFGYMLYSGLILVPLFLAVTVIFL